MSYVRSQGFSDSCQSLGFAQCSFRRHLPAFFLQQTRRERNTMNAETSTQNPFPTSAENSGSNGTTGLNGDANRVRRMAQTLHEAVDSLEQKLGSSSERVMGLQEEYGNMARDQVRSNPLAALGVAFAAGFIISRILR
jgi:ElaB/YqjD/DUF883 family membrane-anchored ribosome-binding protein